MLKLTPPRKQSVAGDGRTEEEPLQVCHHHPRAEGLPGRGPRGTQRAAAEGEQPRAVPERVQGEVHHRPLQRGEGSQGRGGARVQLQRGQFVLGTVPPAFPVPPFQHPERGVDSQNYPVQNCHPEHFRNHPTASQPRTRPQLQLRGFVAHSAFLVP